MRLIPTAILCLLFSTFAAAQTTAYSVAVFPPSTTNPATATPVAPAVSYPASAVPCGQPKAAETAQPIINPYEGRFDDPVDSTKDCAMPIDAQIQALPVGAGYLAAYQPLVGATPGAWSPLSTPFAVVAAQTTHPCDGTAPTTGTVQAGARTISWCYSGLDANGQPTTVTGWAAYVDGVRSTLGTVTVGATANGAGLKLYQAPITLAAGSHVVQIAGVNATGEAVKSVSFSSTVTVPPAAPAAAIIRGIQ
jgi:hypothetical protein